MAPPLALQGLRLFTMLCLLTSNTAAVELLSLPTQQADNIGTTSDAPAEYTPAPLTDQRPSGPGALNEATGGILDSITDGISFAHDVPGRVYLERELLVVQNSSWPQHRAEAPESEVLDEVTLASECLCRSRCMARDLCLSFSYHPDTHRCTLYNVRGNVGSLRPWSVFYKRGLALLGDWCSSDWECGLLTSGVAVCRDNTCSCLDGRYQLDRTTCGFKSTTSIVKQATTAPTESPSRDETQPVLANTTAADPTQEVDVTRGTEAPTTAVARPEQNITEDKIKEMTHTEPGLKANESYYVLGCENFFPNKILVVLEDRGDFFTSWKR
ncbi:uncharacterized protein LOC122388349 [Amphibalanus amphitrite]|uniref:uncharacterized protein LOC122388349 n=1 Tax=Amphibalanus amphitrite TaxID=1232801 RepID=UPI001C90A31D|nr:uncharacterized protein LOC122388349 [Amphibalanus amphitrite]